MSEQSIKETMQQALEAIEQYAAMDLDNIEQYPAMDLDNIKPSRLLVYNLRKAIADCEQATDTQEPVAWTQRNHVVGLSVSLKRTVYHTVPLYTHPSNVRRLTAKEERALINPIMHEYGISAAPFLELIDKVQDAMMKSNGGEL